MIIPRLTYCPECPDVLSLIRDIDCQLMYVSDDLYNNTVFMLNRYIDGEVIIDLINYKRILFAKYCNSDYASTYTLAQIASRVKMLTLGVTCTNCDEIVRTSTSTTTAVPTTSTSTTAGPTTTSTTTAIAYTTTTTTSIIVNLCDSTIFYQGGQSYPNITYVTLGVDLGNVTIDYDTYSIPDKFEIWFDGVMVVDTGYRGSAVLQTFLNNALIARGEPTERIVGPAAGSATFYKDSATTVAEVRIYAPMDNTYWQYYMSCPDGVIVSTTTSTSSSTTTSTTSTSSSTTTTTTTVIPYDYFWVEGCVGTEYAGRTAVIRSATVNNWSANGTGVNGNVIEEWGSSFFYNGVSSESAWNSTTLDGDMYTEWGHQKTFVAPTRIGCSPVTTTTTSTVAVSTTTTTTTISPIAYDYFIIRGCPVPEGTWPNGWAVVRSQSLNNWSNNGTGANANVIDIPLNGSFYYDGVSTESAWLSNNQDGNMWPVWWHQYTVSAPTRIGCHIPGS